MTPPRAREQLLEARDLVARTFGILDRIVGALDEPERSAVLLLRDDASELTRKLTNVSAYLAETRHTPDPALTLAEPVP